MAPPMASLTHSKWALPLPADHGDPTNGFIFPDDPFTDLHRGNLIYRRSQRSSIEDTPMPDYVPSLTTGTDKSRAVSDMTGLSYEQKEGPMTSSLISEAAIEELVRALSPQKKDELLAKALSPSKPTSGGILAPTNTPSSVPPMVIKTSAAAQARAASYGKASGRGVSIELTLSPNQSGLQSGACTKPAVSNLPEEAITNASADPADSIRSMKRAPNENENKENVQRDLESSLDTAEGTTNISLLMAESSGGTSILASSSTNQSKACSSVSKRKRIVSDTRDTAVDDTLKPSPNKRMSSLVSLEATSPVRQENSPLSDVKVSSVS